MRICKFCGEEKPDEEFHKNINGLPRRRCKRCVKKYDAESYQKDLEKSRAAGRASYANAVSKNPKFYAERNKKKRLESFGLTLEQWDEMMLNQGGMCAICEGESTLGVDHDHKTGKVRALLCSNCNTAIGLLKDSADRATKAAEYLKKHSAT